MDSPEVLMLVVLYNPTGEGGHMGGGTAAPIGAEVFADILPYLETKTNAGAGFSPPVIVPDVRNKTISEAEKELKNAGLKTNDVGVGVPDNPDFPDAIVTNQEPKPGISIPQGATVYLYL